MQSPDNSRSRTRSTISLGAALVVALALVGCGNDDIQCGPEDAPANGMTMTVGSDTVSFDRWTSSPNNDCSVDGHPTSLTLDGIQEGGTFHIAFCLPRPDDLGGVTQLSDTNLIEIVTVSAEIGGCTVVLDPMNPATGTIEFAGYCSDGLSDGGYAVELNGSVNGIQTCNMMDTPVTIQLGGRFAVEAL